jgi:hypothetical protein
MQGLKLETFVTIEEKTWNHIFNTGAQQRDRDREVENTGGNRTPKIIIAGAAASSTKRKWQAGAA